MPSYVTTVKMRDRKYGLKNVVKWSAQPIVREKVEKKHLTWVASSNTITNSFPIFPCPRNLTIPECIIKGSLYTSFSLVNSSRRAVGNTFTATDDPWNVPCHTLEKWPQATTWKNKQKDHMKPKHSKVIYTFLLSWLLTRIFTFCISRCLSRSILETSKTSCGFGGVTGPLIREEKSHIDIINIYLLITFALKLHLSRSFYHFNNNNNSFMSDYLNLWHWRLLP